MGRLIAVVTAFTLLIPAAPTAAAELTRVLSSGEADHAFAMDLSLGWERVQRSATITREHAEPSSPGDPAYPFATVQALKQLRYTETTNLLVPRLAMGLWEDLDLAFELPYYLSQETTWRLASGVGVDPALPDTITGNTLDPNGQDVYPAGPPYNHALFPVTGTQTVYHGGVIGDLKVGLRWAPFSQRRDDTKPTWVVGVDFTVPTAKLYDPALNRGVDWGSPYNVSSQTGPVGQKVWRYTLHTELSRRMGSIEPYFQASLTLLQKSSSTYSNCDHAAELAAPSNGADPQLQSTAGGGIDAAGICRASPDRWGAKLPVLSGLTFGTELVPYEDRAAGQKITFDLRLSADHTSAARWYNELTDATGKLLATGSYVALTGRAGVVFRASDHVSVQASGAVGWVTPHDLTGEDFDSRDQNPNFDWRYDAPGRRFRSSEGTVFDLQLTGLLQF